MDADIVFTERERVVESRMVWVPEQVKVVVIGGERVAVGRDLEIVPEIDNVIGSEVVIGCDWDFVSVEVDNRLSVCAALCDRGAGLQALPVCDELRIELHALRLHQPAPVHRPGKLPRAVSERPAIPKITGQRTRIRCFNLQIARFNQKC